MAEIVIVANDEKLREMTTKVLEVIGISAVGVGHQEARSAFLAEKPKRIVIFDYDGEFSEGARTQKIVYSIFGSQAETKMPSYLEKKILIEAILSKAN